jgi:hypothetical protein
LELELFGGWGGRKGRGRQNDRKHGGKSCARLRLVKRARRAVPLQGAEEFVEFVGGVEVGFEVAGGEAFAEVVETAGEKVEGGGEDFFVG